MASSSPLFTLGLLPRHLFLISASVPGKMRADNCTSITRVWPWTGRPSTSTTHKHQLLMGYRSRLTQLDMSDNNDRLASQTKQLVIKAKICPTFKADCEPKLIWLFSSYYTVKLRTSKLTPHDRHTCLELQPLALSSSRVWVTSHGFVQLNEKVFPSCSLSNIRHSQVPLKHSSTCQLTAGGWRKDHIKTHYWRSEDQRTAEYCIFILKCWKNKPHRKSMNDQKWAL